MKRFAGLILSWGLLLLAMAPMASAAQGVISASPPSGPPGTSVTVIISGFGGAFDDVEIHEGGKSGTLLGTGSTNSSGIGGIPITIPSGAPPGPYVIYACASCSSQEFHPEATTTFDVTEPPTTTEAPATTGTSAPPPPPPPPPTEPCAIPDDALVMDFEDLGGIPGTTEDLFSDLQNATLDIWYRQWSEYVLFTDPSTQDTPSYLLPPRINSVAIVTDDPAEGETSSPLWAMRLFDDTHWSYWSNWPRDLVPDYFGFNVGFGHFGEGFETPDEVIVELHVTAMPMTMPDETILDQGAWDPVGITLGPGPQPVLNCIEARDTTGIEWHPETVFLIDILPRTADGRALHIPLDIDDFYWGPYEPPPPPLEFDEGELPVIAEPAPDRSPPETVGTALLDVEEPPDPSDFWWRAIFALGGLLAGAGAMWAFRPDRKTP